MLKTPLNQTRILRNPGTNRLCFSSLQLTSFTIVTHDAKPIDRTDSGSFQAEMFCPWYTLYVSILRYAEKANEDCTHSTLIPSTNRSISHTSSNTEPNRTAPSKQWNL